MAISVNPYVSPRIVTVLNATSITMQQLVNQVMEWEEMPQNLTFERIIKPSGKQMLSLIESVGITATLLNAKLKFEDPGTPTVCVVSGGNLTAVNAIGNYMEVIDYTNNVTVSYAKSSSATMVQDADIDAIKLKTDHLPVDPASETLVQDVHDTIGAPTSTIAGDVDAIETEVIGIKGTGWTDETLKKLKELIETVSGGGGTNIKV